MDSMPPPSTPSSNSGPPHSTTPRPHAAGQVVAGPAVGEAQPPPVSMGRTVAKWTLRGSVAGVLVSFFVHGVFLLIAAVWIIGGGGGAAAGGGTDRELGGGGVEMAIATETELGAIADAAAGFSTPITTAEDAVAASPSDISLDAPSAETTVKWGAGDGGLGDGLGGAGGEGGGICDGLGDGFGGGSGSGGAAKFFGMEATGTRFAYVVDVSGSMQGPKISSLKIELIESVDALLEHMQFFVAPYSTDVGLLGNKEKWTTATDAGKKWARDKIMDLESFGGTNPTPAFQKVFELKPRPDAVYFMTDGLFADEVADLVAVMNKRGKRVAIHCIAFDIQDPAVEKLMRRIAEESGGRYSAVPLNGRSRK